MPLAATLADSEYSRKAADRIETPSVVSVNSSEATIAHLKTPGRNLHSSYDSALASRAASRAFALKIADAEIDRLYRQRTMLVDCEINGTLGLEGERQLRLVRWQLDRIDDARGEVSLDALEREVNLYEQVATRINRLRDEIDRAMRPTGDERRED